MDKFCPNCGNKLKQDIKFCNKCGKSLTKTKVGYSSAINSKAMQEQIDKRKTNLAVGFVMSSIVLIIFTILGFIVEDLAHPLGIIIGLILSFVFMSITIYSKYKEAKDNSARHIDGIVIDKYITYDKDYDYDDSGDKVYHEEHLVYRVEIELKTRKIKKIVEKGDYRSDPKKKEAKFYKYYQIGDIVRYHPKLDYYEKYDKSNDSYIVCAICHKENDLSKKTCIKCKAPLLV